MFITIVEVGATFMVPKLLKSPHTVTVTPGLIVRLAPPRTFID
ncbi:MAG: hypothetical protein ACO1G9_10890 [Bacteroidota bacterium]